MRSNSAAGRSLCAGPSLHIDARLARVPTRGPWRAARPTVAMAAPGTPLGQLGPPPGHEERLPETVAEDDALMAQHGDALAQQADALKEMKELSSDRGEAARAVSPTDAVGENQNQLPMQNRRVVLIQGYIDLETVPKEVDLQATFRDMMCGSREWNVPEQFEVTRVVKRRLMVKLELREEWDSDPD